jgi:UPF0755 protein
VKFRVGQRVDKSRLHKRFGLVLAVLVALGIVAYVGVERWYQHNLRAPSHESSEILFTVTPGASTSEVATQLQEAGAVRSATVFVWYLSRLDGQPTIQAGSYRLNSAFTTAEVADILVNGRIDTSLITILPGLRLDQIKQTFIEYGFSTAEIEAAFKADYNHPLLRYKKDSDGLEGYIYPETLQITEDSTVQSIIKRSFDAFYDQLGPTLLEGIGRQNLSPHQAIILASIIQKEASGQDDQRKIAQVFLSRLETGMPLGADATFRYAAALEGVEPTTNIDSPYNTRLHAGLPPGPIGNFTIKALEAVANPADTDYLYFVHGDDCLEPGGSCSTYFARTQAEHDANVARYCSENCRL